MNVSSRWWRHIMCAYFSLTGLLCMRLSSLWTVHSAAFSCVHRSIIVELWSDCDWPTNMTPCQVFCLLRWATEQTHENLCSCVFCLKAGRWHVCCFVFYAFVTRKLKALERRNYEEHIIVVPWHIQDCVWDKFTITPIIGVVNHVTCSRRDHVL